MSTYLFAYRSLASNLQTRPMLITTNWVFHASWRATEVQTKLGRHFWSNSRFCIMCNVYEMHPQAHYSIRKINILSVARLDLFIRPYCAFASRTPYFHPLTIWLRCTEYSRWVVGMTHLCHHKHKMHTKTCSICMAATETNCVWCLRPVFHPFHCSNAKAAAPS